MTEAQRKIARQLESADGGERLSGLRGLLKTPFPAAVPALLGRDTIAAWARELMDRWENRDVDLVPNEWYAQFLNERSHLARVLESNPSAVEQSEFSRLCLDELHATLWYAKAHEFPLSLCDNSQVHPERDWWWQPPQSEEGTLGKRGVIRDGPDFDRNVQDHLREVIALLREAGGAPGYPARRRCVVAAMDLLPAMGRAAHRGGLEAKDLRDAINKTVLDPNLFLGWQATSGLSLRHRLWPVIQTREDRSAIQFITEFGDDTEALQGAVILAETWDYDLSAELEPPTEPAPLGTPSSHWWWTGESMDR